jgi:hypothetical protein
VTSKDDVLAFIRGEVREQEQGRGVTVAEIARRFELTEEGATKHVERAFRAQLVEPDRAGYIKAVRWTITERGLRRLHYRRDGGTRATIEFA